MGLWCVAGRTACGLGAEAWRVLARRFDSAGPACRRSALVALLNPGRVALEKLGSHLAQWYEQLRLYEQRSGAPLATSRSTPPGSTRSR